ncbi:hypothetical protein J4229_03845, partial [Candidatus Pacearchaeota archaeon]|nr:hypothetical protein [Candidatus Pacearchaeota archaeon]
MLALNSLVIDFNIGVVDPAGIVDCRYSNQLKNYNDMTEKLDCVSARFENDEVIADEADLEQNFVQQCSKQIPLDLSLDTYDVYVSCKDELGNFHNPAQKFSYRKGKILSMEIKVDDSVYSGAVLELEGRRHSLIASTKGGDNDKSICKYSYSFNDAPFTNMTTFEDTSKITNPITAANAVIQKIHTLILDNLLINSGDYKFKINCYDPIGNDLNSDVMLRARIVGSSGVGTATT